MCPDRISGTVFQVFDLLDMSARSRGLLSVTHLGKDNGFLNLQVRVNLNDGGRWASVTKYWRSRATTCLAFSSLLQAL